MRDEKTGAEAGDDVHDEQDPVVLDAGEACCFPVSAHGEDLVAQCCPCQGEMANDEDENRQYRGQLQPQDEPLPIQVRLGGRP